MQIFLDGVQTILDGVQIFLDGVRTPVENPGMIIQLGFYNFGIIFLINMSYQ